MTEKFVINSKGGWRIRDEEVCGNEELSGYSNMTVKLVRHGIRLPTDTYDKILDSEARMY